MAKGNCWHFVPTAITVTLINPRKTFKKVLSKLAAQTRYGAIKNTPLK